MPLVRAWFSFCASILAFIGSKTFLSADVHRNRVEWSSTRGNSFPELVPPALIGAYASTSTISGDGEIRFECSLGKGLHLFWQMPSLMRTLSKNTETPLSPFSLARVQVNFVRQSIGVDNENRALDVQFQEIYEHGSWGFSGIRIPIDEDVLNYLNVDAISENETQRRLYEARRLSCMQNERERKAGLFSRFFDVTPLECKEILESPRIFDPLFNPDVSRETLEIAYVSKEGEVNQVSFHPSPRAEHYELLWVINSCRNVQ